MCVCVFYDCLLAKKRQTTDNKTKTGIERIIYFRLYCVRHAPRIQSIISPGRARFQIRAIVVIFGSAMQTKIIMMVQMTTKMFRTMREIALKICRFVNKNRDGFVRYSLTNRHQSFQFSQIISIQYVQNILPIYSTVMPKQMRDINTWTI